MCPDQELSQNIFLFFGIQDNTGTKWPTQPGQDLFDKDTKTALAGVAQLVP